VTNIGAHLRWIHFHNCDDDFAKQPSCSTFGHEAGAPNYRWLKFWTNQQKVEERRAEKSTTCWGARTLYQIQVVSHSNYLLSGRPSAQGLSSQRCNVISYVIKGFLVHNVLVDTGNTADIIFAKAFRQMQELEDKIHDATHPLCGFGGRQIVVLGKITMPVTFGYVHNTRTE
jgi:hypothetical protein